MANPCGAVFIDPWWVLTAGHCFARNVDPFLPDPQQQIPVPKVFNVNNVQPGKVFVGGVDRFNDAEFVIREFADIIVHPLYWANNGSNDPTNPYDLTLILMKEPIFELKPIQINRNRRLPRLGETLRYLLHSVRHCLSEAMEASLHRNALLCIVGKHMYGLSAHRSAFVLHAYYIQGVRLGLHSQPDSESAA